MKPSLKHCHEIFKNAEEFFNSAEQYQKDSNFNKAFQEFSQAQDLLECLKAQMKPWKDSDLKRQLLWNKTLSNLYLIEAAISYCKTKEESDLDIATTEKSLTRIQKLRSKLIKYIETTKDAEDASLIKKIIENADFYLANIKESLSDRHYDEAQKPWLDKASRETHLKISFEHMLAIKQNYPETFDFKRQLGLLNIIHELYDATKDSTDEYLSLLREHLIINFGATKDSALRFEAIHYHFILRMKQRVDPLFHSFSVQDLQSDYALLAEEKKAPFKTFMEDIDVWVENYSNSALLTEESEDEITASDNELDIDFIESMSEFSEEDEEDLDLNLIAESIDPLPSASQDDQHKRKRSESPEPINETITRPELKRFKLDEKALEKLAESDRAQTLSDEDEQLKDAFLHAIDKVCIPENYLDKDFAANLLLLLAEAVLESKTNDADIMAYDLLIAAHSFHAASREIHEDITERLEWIYRRNKVNIDGYLKYRQNESWHDRELGRHTPAENIRAVVIAKLAEVRDQFEALHSNAHLATQLNALYIGWYKNLYTSPFIKKETLRDMLPETWEINSQQMLVDALDSDDEQLFQLKILKSTADGGRLLRNLLIHKDDRMGIPTLHHAITQGQANKIYWFFNVLTENLGLENRFMKNILGFVTSSNYNIMHAAALSKDIRFVKYLLPLYREIFGAKATLDALSQKNKFKKVPCAKTGTENSLEINRYLNGIRTELTLELKSTRSYQDRDHKSNSRYRSESHFSESHRFFSESSSRSYQESYYRSRNSSSSRWDLK